ncbi:hypothetical protein [Hypericibacter sp.]|uniref:hypothetical protein n=1 Tax=Hypericibacter sp. TaxID=2705401 RepID=UPI003D6CDCCB
MTDTAKDAQAERVGRISIAFQEFGANMVRRGVDETTVIQGVCSATITLLVGSLGIAGAVAALREAASDLAAVETATTPPPAKKH